MKKPTPLNNYQHPRVYIRTQAKPNEQTLFKLDFATYGQNKVGIYDETGGGHWVGTIDFTDYKDSDGDTLSFELSLNDLDKFGPDDAVRVMKTFLASGDFKDQGFKAIPHESKD